MNKRILSVIVAIMMVLSMIPAGFAEEVALDPFEEITAEFNEAETVEPYQVVVRPARITGWAVLRWAPSHSAPLMATYAAKQELTVLKETPNWLQVENTTTRDVGYISRKDVTAPDTTSVEHELKMTVADNGKTDLGVIDINGAFSLQCALADGYSIRLTESANDRMAAIVSSEDPVKPVLQLSVGYDEAYADVERLNDLDDEALSILEQTFMDTDPMVEITYGDTGLGTRLMIARFNDGDIDFLDFMSIYKGYFVECVMVPSAQAPDKNLTEEQIQMCIDFLTEMDFVPATPMVGGAQSVTDGRYVTRLSDYSAEENTVQAEVLQEILLDREDVDALKVGDELTIGNESVTVNTLEKDEYGVMVNDEIFLAYAGGTDVIPSMYDHTYYETIATLTLEIPDSLIFMDGIDPSSGEMLDEMTEHTAAEFKDMLAAGTLPGFDEDNVYVTFENGEMVLVERFYTPWQ
jgi:hypothetical protein